MFEIDPGYGPESIPGTPEYRAEQRFRQLEKEVKALKSKLSDAKKQKTRAIKEHKKTKATKNAVR